ncbi:MAG TPA: DMT family transporter [Rhizobiaceae bacterium]|nr:DMT family transporter [Rhizobiaceae bacterium]
MYRNAYVLLLLTTLFWAANSVAGKLAVGHVSPMMLTTLRWTISLALICAIGWKQFARDWPQVRAHWLVLFSLGTVGFTFFNGAMYSALKYTSAINVSIEQAILPMAILAANFLIFGIRVTWLQMAGFALSVFGVAVTASHGDLSRLAQLDVNLGDGLMVVAALFYAAYTLGLRYRPPIHWMSLMTALCAAALVASLPFVAVEIALDAAIMPDAQGWAVAAFTAIFPSLLAQTFYVRGVELIGGNRAGLFINLVPVLGTLMAIAVLGEAFHAYHAAALALVLGGIALAEYSARRHALAQTS